MFGITEAHRRDILEPIVRSHADAIRDAFILMQDNARAHTARVYMTFLDGKGLPGTLFLDVFDNGRIIQRIYRTLSVPWLRKKGSLYSELSSPLDRSKRFTLFAPPLGRLVNSDTNSAFI